MTATELVTLSERENRTVTEYPDTLEAETELLEALMGRVDYVDQADESGDGYSGPESRGLIDVWGETWRISVVRAAS